MNYSLALLLINNAARAVRCTYEKDKHAKQDMFKTLDPEIQVDDLVVVTTSTRHGFTVVKVVEVDVDVDFDDTTEIKWISHRLDMAPFDHLLEQEKTAIAAIRSAEKRKKRDDLRQSLFADHAEEIKALPISTINGETAEE